MFSHKVSRRQAYRFLNQNVQNHIDSINDFNDSQLLEATNTVYSDVHEQCLIVASSSSEECNIENINFDHSSSSNILSLFHHSSSSSDEAYSDHEAVMSGRHEPSFVQKIASWAHKCGIARSHFNQLLCILREHKCFESLPRDSRTILKTPRLTAVKKLGSGLYCNFGLAAGLKDVVQQNNSFSDELELTLNIDGLPIAKSSGSQLWPILCSI